MSSDGYVKDKTKEDLLSELPETANVASPVFEQQRMGIVVRCTQDLEARLTDLTSALSNGIKSGTDLNKRLVWLNGVLTVATLIGAFATLLIAISAFGAA